MSQHDLNAFEAGEKLAKLKKLVLELKRELPAGSKELTRLEELANEFNKEVLELEIRVAPQLTGKDAALLPVMH